MPRGTQWFMQYRDHLIKVDAAAMLNLLDFINTGNIMQRVTKKPDTYPRFGIADETALIITLQTEGKRSTLYVGKSRGPGLSICPAAR